MTPGPDRRWAELAREQEFLQLAEVRRQAEGWRNGLAGTTALLTVLVFVKGRDNLADLSPGGRVTAMVLLGAGFLCLLCGTLTAVRACYGRPGESVYLGGQALRRWTEREVARAGRLVITATVLSVAGVLCVAAAVGVAWSTTQDTGVPPEGGAARIAGR
ncbi:hypothetical protein [Streptomyces aidingensis]|uniref:Uncharacterized protein n=1 Tax=Streptomyces aidingensis TaxID=910347 RepID=A0A1I1JH51_9ACTN|nr:hypothetical protein [Streptomyces aidingensis]SFC47675.1 hypothetical protein SAMN05421773_103413 [Streptomyces aidingensis]